MESKIEVYVADALSASNARAKKIKKYIEKVFDALPLRFFSSSRRTRRSLGEERANSKERIAIQIYLVSDAFMQKLNKEYRGKDKTTNVLSFNEPNGFINPEHVRNLGEIYLSPAYIKKHHEEMELMVIHGILHLLGFDHVSIR